MHLCCVTSDQCTESIQSLTGTLTHHPADICTVHYSCQALYTSSVKEGDLNYSKNALVWIATWVSMVDSCGTVTAMPARLHWNLDSGNNLKS